MQHVQYIGWNAYVTTNMQMFVENTIMKSIMTNTVHALSASNKEYHKAKRTELLKEILSTGVQLVNVSEEILLDLDLNTFTSIVEFIKDTYILTKRKSMNALNVGMNMTRDFGEFM